MFKKKPHIKSLAPLRSSDRRKVIDQIIRDYDIPTPETPAAPVSAPVDSNEAVDGQASAAPAAPTGITALRNGLLPEGAQSARFTTTLGADLRTVSGTVYAAAHPGEGIRVLWVRVDEQIVPTVHTLWRHPGLLPLLHTPDIVLQKMRGGADLMTPGLARGPPFPDKAKKDAVVAVAAYERPSVPLLVGVCEIDVSALQDVRGAKGHAVRGINWIGDEVWSWGEGPDKEAPEEIKGWYSGASDGQVPNLEALSLDGEVNGEDGVAAVNGDSKQSESRAEVAEVVSEPSRTWTTKEVDEAFRSALLYAMHDAKQKHQREPGHGFAFPMPQSQFISGLILPYLPIFTPEDGAALQIKKSSWKNYQKFIKALDKELLVKSKVRNGGETVVTDLDFEDRQLQTFTPYKLPKKTGTSSSQQQSDSSSTPSSTSDPSVGQKLHILNLLRPKPSLHTVCTVAQADPHGLYLPTELRLVVNRYLEAEDLLRPNDRGRVTINPILADALYSSATTSAGADSDAQQALVQGHVARDTLLTRAQTHACTSLHLIQRTPPSGASAPEASRSAAASEPGRSRLSDADRSKAASGAAPKVKITLETRSGNKTATRVSGLEPFYVNVHALADELQKVCAGATSVGPLVGSKPSKPVLEIMVQGPQRDAVLRQLERRGVRAAWVDVLDKTKTKKKK